GHSIQPPGGDARVAGPVEPCARFSADPLQVGPQFDCRVKPGAIAADSGRDRQRAGQLRLKIGARGASIRDWRALRICSTSYDGPRRWILCEQGTSDFFPFLLK